MAERFSLSNALQDEHHQIDEGLARFRAGLENGERHNEAFTTAATALRRHIYIEEDFLFPELRRAGLVGPVVVMIREHGEIWQALDDIDAALAGDGDTAHVLDACNRLLTILEAHNFKEEQILYPTADEVLSPEGTEKLRDTVEFGVRPAGWRCEAALA